MLELAYFSMNIDKAHFNNVTFGPFVRTQINSWWQTNWEMILNSLQLCLDLVLSSSLLSIPLLQLSPKKTYEGFFGGGLITVFVGTYISCLMARSAYLSCPAVISDWRTSVSWLDVVQIPATCEPKPIFVSETLDVSQSEGKGFLWVCNWCFLSVVFFSCFWDFHSPGSLLSTTVWPSVWSVRWLVHSADSLHQDSKGHARGRWDWCLDRYRLPETRFLNKSKFVPSSRSARDPRVHAQLENKAGFFKHSKLEILESWAFAILELSMNLRSESRSPAQAQPISFFKHFKVHA